VSVTRYSVISGRQFDWLMCRTSETDQAPFALERRCSGDRLDEAFSLHLWGGGRVSSPRRIGRPIESKDTFRLAVSKDVLYVPRITTSFVLFSW